MKILSIKSLLTSLYQREDVNSPLSRGDRGVLPLFKKEGQGEIF